MKNSLEIAIIVVAIVVVFASSMLLNKPVDPVARNTEILHEVNRLMPLADAGTITLADTTALGKMIDTNATDKFDELQWMVSHGYQHHALHALQSIYWIEKGKAFPCPAEVLSHVGLYLQAGDMQRAQRAAAEGARQLAEWEPITRADKAKDPTVYPDLDNIIFMMNKELSDMSSGKYSAVISDAAFLDQNGYC